MCICGFPDFFCKYARYPDRCIGNCCLTLFVLGLAVIGISAAKYYVQLANVA